MKTLKYLFTVFSFSLISYTASAQEEMDLAIHTSSYKTAIGLRAGETSGLTIKQFIGGRHALEGIAGVWYHGLSATLLYEHYSPAFDLAGLNWYYGIGGHFSAQSSRSYFYSRYDRFDRYDSGSFGLGVDGIFGLEYKILNAPIAMSLDLKPYVEITSNGGVWLSLDPGIGFKVAF